MGTDALSGPKAAYLFCYRCHSKSLRGRIMKINSLSLRLSFLSITALLCLLVLRELTFAQNRQGTKPKTTLTGTKKSQNLKPFRAEDLEAKQEGADFLRRRQDWFFKPRAFPLGFIPQGARERALEQKKQMYIREGRLGSFVVRPEVGFLAPASLTTSAWSAIGPQPTSSPFFNPPFTSGRVTALAVNPNNANNVYLGAADGGLWVTTNGGTAWTPLTDNPPNAANIPTVAVGAIAVDPTTCATGGICTTVYVGTGEDNFSDSIYGEGVLNCTVTAGPPPTATCTQDSTFHTLASPLDDTRGGPMIGALAVSRTTNSILLAGVHGRGTAIESGVWCSSNKGATWTEVLPTSLTNGAGDSGTDVAFASDGTAWVALGFVVPEAPNGIYKSSVPVASCSITFNQQALPAAFTASNIGRITLALAPSNNAVIFAAIANGTSGSANLLGVVRSTNATAATPTWTQLSDPLVSPDTATTAAFCSGQCLYDMALSVDPVSPDVVYAGGSSAHPIIRTTNGTTTATWTDVTAPTGTATVPHVDTHAFAFAGNGSTVFVGNDGGVWGSNTPNGALSWVNLNGPTTTSTGALNITQFYPGVSIHPSNPAFAIGGTQDNDVQVDQAYLPGTGLLWQGAGLGCDGGYTAIDLAIPSTSYGECEYLPGAPGFPIIAFTFNGDGILGNGFLANLGIDNTDRGSFIPPLVMDPTNTLTLYFGTCRVWQTKDGANTWSAISPDVTSASHTATTCPVPTTSGQPAGVLSTVAVAPSSSSTIYVGSDDGDIEVTSNGGTSWTSIATMTLPTRAVTQVVVDPTTPATAYATFSGFGTCSNSAVTCDQKGHVFKTLNGTAGAATTWVDISGTTTKLPDIPLNALVIDPNVANTLYVGTDIGAFFTSDGGVTWSPLGAANSMPNAEILSLTLHNPSRTLRAATHGRGVWDLNLGGLPTFAISSVSPFSANAGSAAITTFTVNGNGFTANSKVQFALNGTTTTLTPTSSTLPTQLVATIPQTALASGGLAQVSVTDSTQPTSPTNTLPFTVLNSIPTIVSISPTTTTAGTNGLTITVTGTGNSYVGGANGTVVLFNGFSRPTTFVNANQLTATLSVSDLAVGQLAAIDTFTPQPGGGPDIGQTQALTITNPVPTLTSISPTTKAAGSGAFTLTVNGTNFAANSVVNFNGTAKTTTFVNSMLVTASILATDIATGGSDPVTVTNPAPGGGTTTAQTFTVTGGPDFTLTPQSTTATVNAGTSAMYTVAVAGTNGFSSNVNVTCSLSLYAAATTCAANPASVAPGNNTTITVTTMAHQLLPPTKWPRRFEPGQRLLPLLLAIFSLVLLVFAVRTRRRRLAILAPLASVILIAALQAVGCGGGYNAPGQHGTQPGTYTVTITGTSGATTHTTTVSLTVN